MMKYIPARKSLGQNFLADNNMAIKIVKSAEISKEDSVIEIGPGTGLLTVHIVEYAENITLVELDQRAIALLEAKFFNSAKNLKIVQKDFRKFDIYEEYQILNKRFSVIGNIPYYITGDIFFKLFENAQYIKSAVITLQKEVAVRMASKINTKDYGILAIAAQYCSDPKYLFDIPSACFIPKPNVTSSVIKLNFKENFNLIEYKKLMKVVKQSFNQRRKMISNTLKGMLKEGFDEQIWDKYKHKRPENLSINEFIELMSICKD
ncbi:MAG TPA: 16S rRNA (adenine(1518)-N(6)/adenine(1519)-N(6))-dimethyltransferase RsmA [Candidatus Kapabacteria bacterium]|nr:16S rRNA (adenine(1518)-N(6)/adenine(1519)-N(6))-dimethyltransferase RsmA [Candidatus Kapabacteria bacterium]